MRAVYLPDFGTQYFDPSLPVEVIRQRKTERKDKLDAALLFLSMPDNNRPSEAYSDGLNGRITCRPCVSNSACNLASYLLNHAPRVARSAICCIPQDHHREEVRRPIPESAYDTLAHTRTQFERNTFGLFCIAPAAIVAAPLIVVSDAVNIALGIMANCTITTTAGINTYVFSGDIGAVPDGRGGLVIQGGIRVDAIQEIKRAYTTLSEHLLESWKAASGNPEELIRLTQLSKDICSQWKDIYHGIADCGIRTASVEDILEPLATVLFQILSQANIEVASPIQNQPES